MKTIRGASGGDTFIRPYDNWLGRAVPAIWGCLWLYLGYELSSSSCFVQLAYESGPFASELWQFYAIWLIGFAVICANIVWSFFGMTKISISSDEIVVRNYIWGDNIYSSGPIKLSTIRNVFIKEREYARKGNTSRRWVLTVHLEDGSTQEIAKFRSVLDADAFMQRHVEF